MTPLREADASGECYWSVTYHGPTRGQSVDGFLRLAKNQLHTVLPRRHPGGSSSSIRRNSAYLDPPRPVEYDWIARVCLGRGGYFTLWGEQEGVCAHYSSPHAIAICQDISLRLAAALAPASRGHTPRPSPRGKATAEGSLKGSVNVSQAHCLALAVWAHRRCARW